MLHGFEAFAYIGGIATSLSLRNHAESMKHNKKAFSGQQEKLKMRLNTMQEIQSQESLKEVLTMVEASQSRERDALNRLNIMKESAQRDAKRSQNQIQAQRQRFKAQEVVLEAEIDMRLDTLETENRALRAALRKSETHCSVLREQLAAFVQKESAKQDSWQARLDALESGVQNLVSSTSNAFRGGSNSHNNSISSLCKYCCEKSDTIADLRKSLKFAETALQGRLQQHSDFIAQVHNCFEDVGKAAEVASLGLGLQTPRQDNGSQDFRTLVDVENENGQWSEEVESLRKSDALLRGMLAADRDAMARLQTQIDQERKSWVVERGELCQRLHQQELLHAEEIKQLQCVSKRLERRLDKFLTLPEANSARLYDPVTIQKLKDSFDHMSSIWRESSSTNEAQLILLTELQVLRSKTDKYKKNESSMQEEIHWLQVERDAIAQGLARQQACVQDQLKTLALLRGSFEKAYEERASFAIQTQHVFQAIQNSYTDTYITSICENEGKGKIT